MISWNEWLASKNEGYENGSPELQAQDLMRKIHDHLFRQATFNLDPKIMQDYESWTMIDNEFRGLQNNEYVRQMKFSNFVGNCYELWVRLKETMNQHKFPGGQRRAKYDPKSIDWNSYNADISPLYRQLKTMFERLQQALEKRTLGGQPHPDFNLR